MSRSYGYLKNPLVVLREEFDDWAILYNPDNAHAVGINPIGVKVWKMLDGRIGTAEMADELRKRFTEVPSSAPEDIASFIQELEKEGFVGREI
jgi:SynChlorMet cassette protein ScmD